MLIRLLNSHPEVYAEGESFNLIGSKPVGIILSRIFSSKPRRIKAAGFKIFYNHPRDRESISLWDTLINDKELHVIHLKRKNVLRTLVSQKIAMQTIWNPNQKIMPQGKEVSFTKDELIKDIEATLKWQEQYAEKFQGHPTIDIYYEDLANDVVKAMRPVLSFLGLDERELSLSTKKQNPEPLKDLIVNFDELKSQFKHTSYSQWFG